MERARRGTNHWEQQATMSIIDRLPQMALQTAGLERDYEKAAAASARLLDAERDRVRRMEHLLLQFERDALRSQLDQANEQALRLAKAESDTCQQFGEACMEIERLDHHMQASSAEIERLQVSGSPTATSTFLIPNRKRSQTSTTIRLATIQLSQRSSVCYERRPRFGPKSNGCRRRTHPIRPSLRKNAN